MTGDIASSKMEQPGITGRFMTCESLGRNMISDFMVSQALIHSLHGTSVPTGCIC